MITIPQIRQANNQILVLGNHRNIIQSILDFDYLSGKKRGSIVGIVTGRTGYAKYFYGRQEILIPTLSTSDHPIPDRRGTHDPGSQIDNLSKSNRPTLSWFLNLLSSRRTLSSTLDLLDPGSNYLRTGFVNFSRFVNLSGGVIFAENVPELHSLQLINLRTGLPTGKTGFVNSSNPLIIGPASVGLLVPGVLKLGPIGGITPTQMKESKLIQSGSVAILSASGGMTNELINIAIGAGHHISFALSFGGDRFPILFPREAFLLAESDPLTKTVFYYGELGGEDEYELVKLKEEGKFTKNVIAHIGGTVASLFKEAPQFGHAKAKANKEAETAFAKRKALQSAGFQVSNSFSEFIDFVSHL